MRLADHTVEVLELALLEARCRTETGHGPDFAHWTTDSPPLDSKTGQPVWASAARAECRCRCGCVTWELRRATVTVGPDDVPPELADPITGERVRRSIVRDESGAVRAL